VLVPPLILMSITSLNSYIFSPFNSRPLLIFWNGSEYFRNTRVGRKTGFCLSYRHLFVISLTTYYFRVVQFNAVKWETPHIKSHDRNMGKNSITRSWMIVLIETWQCILHHNSFSNGMFMLHNIKWKSLTSACPIIGLYEVCGLCTLFHVPSSMPRNYFHYKAGLATLSELDSVKVTSRDHRKSI